MNEVILVGNLVRDFELKSTVARSTIAVQRDFGKGVDYIDINAFGNTAEVCIKYGKKGTLVGVVGSWNTYKDKDKKTHHSCAIREFKILVRNEQKQEPTPDYPVEINNSDEEEINISEDDLPF